MKLKEPEKIALKTKRAVALEKKDTETETRHQIGSAAQGDVMFLETWGMGESRNKLTADFPELTFYLALHCNSKLQPVKHRLAAGNADIMLRVQ